MLKKIIVVTFVIGTLGILGIVGFSIHNTANRNVILTDTSSKKTIKQPSKPNTLNTSSSTNSITQQSQKKIITAQQQPPRQNIVNELLINYTNATQSSLLFISYEIGRPNLFSIITPALYYY